MEKIAAILYLLLFPYLLPAQDARINTFSHTLRWESESKFPNYFMIREIRDSIYSGVKQVLKTHLKVQDISFPSKVDYRIINGFGKPKNELSTKMAFSGYSIDLFSFITKKTAGYGVNWSVNVVIRKDDKLILSKEVTHEIENSNSASYLTEKRWMSPLQFQQIFCRLIREAVSGEDLSQEKIEVGTIEDQEKEVRSWFPNSNRYLLKVTGAMQRADNFAACVVNDKDTVASFVYKNKLDLDIPTISLKSIFAGLFTGITRVGTTYTIKEKERKRGIIEFSNGVKLLIQLDWIEEVTSSTISDEVEVHTSVPLIGQIFIDKIPVGNFIYEKITENISQGEAKVKFNLVSGSYTENSLGLAVLHRVKGTLHDKKFTAEYNELFGLSEIKSESETLASMVFQNCNPENQQSFNKQKLSKNKIFVTTSGSSLGPSSMKKESKQEWYPLFIKKNSTPEELHSGIEILTCLFLEWEICRS